MGSLKKLVCLAALILGDLLAFGISVVAAYALRAGPLGRIIAFELPAVPLEVQLRSGFPLGALLVVLLFATEKLYTQRISFWEESRRLIRAVSLVFVFIMTLVFALRAYTRFSRVVVFLAWVIGLAAFPLVRLAVKKLLTLAGPWRKSLLILGAGRIARHVADEVRRSGTLGYRIAGFLAGEDDDAGPECGGAGIPVLGPVSRAADLARENGIKDFLIALSGNRPDDLIRAAAAVEPLADSVKIVPSVGGLFTIGVEIDHLGDVVALSAPRNLAKPWNIAVKRTYEFVLAAVCLVLLSPVFLAVAIAIRLDSRGPVIFVQRRLGKGGRTFRFFKFRSMHVDADARLDSFLAAHPGIRTEWNAYQKIKGPDPRVTRVGRFLRRWSLDELPQLVNVLAGTMSLVGPRPYLPREIEKIGESHAMIARVKPGVTGLWQVRGRCSLTFEDRLLIDEDYVRNWSLWMDIVILIKTLRAFAGREGAY